MKEKISILMTVYNAQKFISKAIESILNQSYNNFEFIIVDDFSNDESVNIIKRFSDNRIKLLESKKKLGRTKALNFGLNICSSDYIAIQDADDISNSKRIETLMKEFEKNKKLGLVFSNFKIINKDNEFIEKKNIYKNILKKIKYLNLIPHSSIIFKRSGIGEKFFYDESFLYAQDYDLILKFLKFSKISLIDKELIYLRYHSERMTHNELYKKIIILENLRLLNFSEKNFNHNFFDFIILKFYKLKNYLKFIKNSLGV